MLKVHFTVLKGKKNISLTAARFKAIHQQNEWLSVQYLAVNSAL